MLKHYIRYVPLNPRHSAIHQRNRRLQPGSPDRQMGALFEQVEPSCFRVDVFDAAVGAADSLPCRFGGEQSKHAQRYP